METHGERCGEWAMIAHRAAIGGSPKWLRVDQLTGVEAPMAATRFGSPDFIPRSARLWDSQNLSRAAIRGIQFLPFAPFALPPSVPFLSFPLRTLLFSFLSFLFFLNNRVPLWESIAARDEMDLDGGSRTPTGGSSKFPLHKIQRKRIYTYRVVLDGGSFPSAVDFLNYQNYGWISR